MRYHYEKPDFYSGKSGKTYICAHPVYSVCTLYRIGETGLAVIQQRFEPDTKRTYWSEIDAWLVDAIFTQPGFKRLYDKRAGCCSNGLYPTMTVRQIMWALRMKPLKREIWETLFDRREV